MKGLGISKFPNRFCSLWLACQMTVLFGAIVSADDSNVDAAEQIKMERSAQIEDVNKISSEANDLVKAGKFAEASVSYTRAIALLDGMPGEAAANEKLRLEMANNAMKMQWVTSIMDSAQTLFDEGKYSAAAKKASDALFVDDAMIDEVDAFTTRCMTRIKADKFAKETSIQAVYPEIMSDEDQITLLMREAAVFERAHRYSEAQRKLEQVFLIDPLNSDANIRLRKIYNKLYGAAEEQAKGVRYGISADASWAYVPQVVTNRVSDEGYTGENEYEAEADLYSALGDIIIDSIIIEEQEVNRDLYDALNRAISRYPEVKVKIRAGYTTDVEEQFKNKVNLNLTNVPFIDVLRYVCIQTGLKMYVENGNTIKFVEPSSLNDLSTRSFAISSDLIHDIAESDDPYYHLGNVEAAGEERSSGALGSDSGSSSRSSSRSSSSSSSGSAGMMGMMGMMGGTTTTSSSNSDRSSADELLSNAATSGVSNGLTALGFDMATLGIDIDEDSGSSDTKMGGLGTTAPTITPALLKSYFKARGINFSSSGTISYNRRKGEIIVYETVDNLRKLEDLLQQLDEIRSPLVSIEAKLIELSETDIQELGFDWYLDVNTGETDSNWWMDENQNPLRHYSSSSSNSSSSDDSSYRLINDLKIFPNFGESLFGSDAQVNLSLTVNAIAQNSNTEILTSPRLTATSGDLAMIKMVETYTFPESWEDPELDISGSTIEITYPIPDFGDETDVGVVFACRPIVNPDNYTISLYLYPQISQYVGHENSSYQVKLEAGYLVNSDEDDDTELMYNELDKSATFSSNVDIWMPEFTVREMEVNVQVYDGATVVLGGMIEQYNSTRDDQWPILGDIPVIGRLFSSQMTSVEKRNLLIFVTARLINSDGTPWRSREEFGIPEFVW